MLKCKVIESFSGHFVHGTAGETIELPDAEARKFESCGFVTICDEQDPPPMAFATAKGAREFATANRKKR